MEVKHDINLQDILERIIRLEVKIEDISKINRLTVKHFTTYTIIMLLLLCVHIVISILPLLK
jgi:hypothetical protein